MPAQQRKDDAGHFRKIRQTPTALEPGLAALPVGRARIRRNGDLNHDGAVGASDDGRAGGLLVRERTPAEGSDAPPDVQSSS
jgi:hypothetical protein